jgi:hypothetical protein
MVIKNIQAFKELYNILEQQLKDGVIICADITCSNCKNEAKIWYTSDGKIHQNNNIGLDYTKWVANIYSSYELGNTSPTIYSQNEDDFIILLAKKLESLRMEANQLLENRINYKQAELDKTKKLSVVA